VFQPRPRSGVGGLDVLQKMNLFQTPCRISPSLVELGDRNQHTHIRNFTGIYFRVLGWIGVASSIISIATVYWTDHLHLDLSFLIWFWLGASLKKGSPAARKWAIAVMIVMSVFLILSLLAFDIRANYASHRFDRSHPAFYPIIAFTWVVFSVPGIVLLSPRGRAAFTRKS
jgi:hypothetical protein